MRIMKLGDALRGLASQLSADRGRPAIALEVAAAVGNGTTAEVRLSPALSLARGQPSRMQHASMSPLRHLARPVCNVPVALYPCHSVFDLGCALAKICT